MSVTIRLALIAAAMTAFLGFLVISHAAARGSGTEVVLDVRGYDPRDIFLGHFSLITTDLQQLDAAELDGEDDFETGDPLYVVLAPGSDGLWQPVSLHSQRPDAGPFIHGVVRSSYRDDSAMTDPVTGEVIPTGSARQISIRASFNIERYYASRELAQQLDESLRTLNPDGDNGVRLILSLPPNGDAIIKGFEIDGVRRIDRLW
ncbi:GDYXXLXY domain-containing protein [uncultured Maricaulis sp.]|uniref:GDYXXLXY domain-containing protein n=1 Tax=uncultured Maricaulis sp. TaxID=174710 RepID=UPI0030DDC78C|tara:strand:+ start:3144 stop:3755 length:612 start_codon:yes stop_codon:yes gene_type:complete